MFSSPTAARAARVSPVRVSRCTMPVPGSPRRPERRRRSGDSSQPSRLARSAASSDLDLAYLEDRDAEVDANVVMLEPDAFVEVQGTGENGTFDRAELDGLLDLAQNGVRQLFALQRAAIAG